MKLVISILLMSISTICVGSLSHYDDFNERNQFISWQINQNHRQGCNRQDNNSHFKFSNVNVFDKLKSDTSTNNHCIFVKSYK